LDIDISDEKLTNKHIEFVGYNDVTYLIAKGIREADLMPVLIIHSFDTQTLEPGDVLLRQNLLNSTEGFKHTIEPECKLWKQHGKFIYFYLVQNSLESELQIYQLYQYNLEAREKKMVSERVIER